MIDLKNAKYRTLRWDERNWAYPENMNHCYEIKIDSTNCIPLMVNKNNGNKQIITDTPCTMSSAKQKCQTDYESRAERIINSFVEYTR